MTRVTFLLLATALGCAACTGTAQDTPTVPGDVIGQVFTSGELPASGCLVVLEGTPHAGRCDDDGRFEVRNVPAGRWSVLVYEDGEQRAAPNVRLRVGVNPRTVAQLADVKLAAPGRIAGHVRPSDGLDLSSTFVVSEDVGAISIPNAQGAYFLDGVAPGQRGVALISGEGQRDGPRVTVRPSRVTTDVDFDLTGNQAVALSGHLKGVAHTEVGGAQRLVVEALDARDGQVVQGVTIDNGAVFTLELPPRPVVIRARVDGSNPFALVAPLLVKAGGELVLDATLTVPPEQGDLDGDGLPNDQDDDRDGDGVKDTLEPGQLSWDPSDWRDVDGDGLPDRYDLQDDRLHQTSTTDTDADGRFDFEDNCASDANPDQADADQDSVGDACDLCPGLDDLGPLCPFASAARLTVATSGPLQVTAGACSSALTVGVVDRNGRPTATLTERTLRLLGASPALSVWADAACTVPAPMTLPAGARDLQLFFSTKVAGSQRFLLAAAGLLEAEVSVAVRAGPVVNVGQLNLPVRVEAGRCSPPIVVAAVDRFGNRGSLDGAQPLVVDGPRPPQGFPPDLSEGNFQFGYFADPQCSQVMGTRNVVSPAQVLLPADGGTATVYVRTRDILTPEPDSEEGRLPTVVSTPQLPGLPQEQVVFPSAPARFKRLGPDQSGAYDSDPAVRGVAVGACSREVEYGLVDRFGNLRFWPYPERLEVIRGGTGQYTDHTLHVFADARCATELLPNSSDQVLLDVPAGAKRVRVWVTTSSEGWHSVALASRTSVGGSEGTALNFFTSSPSSVLVSGPSELGAQLCSAGWSVRFRDQFGNNVSPSQPVTLAFSGTAGTRFYASDDTTCSTELSSPQFIGAQFDFRVKTPDLTAQPTLPATVQVTGTFGGAPLDAGAHDYTLENLPTSFALTLPTPPFTAGNCYQATVTPLREGVLLTQSAPLGIELSSTEGYGAAVVFSDDPTCVTPGYDGTWTASTASRTFHFSPRKAKSTEALSVRPGSNALAGQGVTYTTPGFVVLPSAPAGLSFSPSGSITSVAGNGIDGGCSPVLGVEVKDAFGNRATPVGGYAVQVAVSPPTGVRLFADQLCSRQLGASTATVDAGTTGYVQFWAASERSEDTMNKSITASHGLSTATASWHIDPLPATKLGWASPPSTGRVGDCPAFTFNAYDDFNNLSTFTGGLTVVLTGTMAIYSDSACTQPLNSVYFDAARRSATFNVKLTGTGTQTVTASPQGAMAISTSLTVTP